MAAGSLKPITVWDAVKGRILEGPFDIQGARLVMRVQVRPIIQLEGKNVGAGADFQDHNICTGAANRAVLGASGLGQPGNLFLQTEF